MSLVSVTLHGFVLVHAGSDSDVVVCGPEHRPPMTRKSRRPMTERGARMHTAHLLRERLSQRSIRTVMKVWRAQEICDDRVRVWMRRSRVVVSALFATTPRTAPWRELRRIHRILGGGIERVCDLSDGQQLIRIDVPVASLDPRVIRGTVAAVRETTKDIWTAIGRPI